MPLDAKPLIRDALRSMHKTLEDVMQDVADEHLDKRWSGATIDTIGEIYSHAVFGEDMWLQQRIKGIEPLFVTSGWDQKPGVAMPEGRVAREWVKRGPIDLKAFGDYAGAVYEATDAYIAGASDEELQREIEGPAGNKLVVASVLLNTNCWHIANHTGEIAALKGMQGLKGLPF